VLCRARTLIRRIRARARITAIAAPAPLLVKQNRRHILFHGKRHPRDLSPGDVGRFLEHVAQAEKDPLDCLEQAHAALTFLSREVLGLDVGALPRAAAPARPPPPGLPRPPVLAPHRALPRHLGGAFHPLPRPAHPATLAAPEIERFLTDLARTPDGQK
jgi:hypothetical protein